MPSQSISVWHILNVFKQRVEEEWGHSIIPPAGLVTLIPETYEY
jgi:hypothetical protein